MCLFLSSADMSISRSTASKRSLLRDLMKSDLSRQIPVSDKRSAGQRNGSLDNMFQFSDIAGKGIFYQCGHGICMEADSPGTVAIKEIRCQIMDILFSMAEGRDFNVEDVQPVKQVFPEEFWRHLT